MFNMKKNKTSFKWSDVLSIKEIQILKQQIQFILVTFLFERKCE